jgi:hypothetical protein
VLFRGRNAADGQIAPGEALPWNFRGFYGSRLIPTRRRGTAAGIT